MKNHSNEYPHTNAAMPHPIGGTRTPYTVIKVATVCVEKTAIRRGIAGLTVQKFFLVLATKRNMCPATESFR